MWIIYIFEPCLVLKCTKIDQDLDQKLNSMMIGNRKKTSKIFIFPKSLKLMPNVIEWSQFCFVYVITLCKCLGQNFFSIDPGRYLLLQRVWCKKRKTREFWSSVNFSSCQGPEKSLILIRHITVIQWKREMIDLCSFFPWRRSILKKKKDSVSWSCICLVFVFRDG